MAGNSRRQRLGEDADVRALVYLYSRLPFLMQRVDQIATALFAAETETLRITPLQFQVLDQLKNGGPGSQADLARFCGIDTSTASLVLKNLIRANLAQRMTDDKDRRRKIVDITMDGSLVHALASAANRRVQARLYVALDKGRDEFVDILLKIVGNAVGAPQWVRPSVENSGLRGCDAPMAESLTFLVRRTFQQAEASLSAELTVHDLTIRQYTALFMTYFHEGITESRLRRMLGYEASNTALVVNILLDKGFIEADPAYAGGRRRYRATSAGKSLLLTVEPALARGEATLAADLSADEVLFVQRMLGKAIVALDNVTRSPLTFFQDIVESSHWPVPIQIHSEPALPF